MIEDKTNDDGLEEMAKKLVPVIHIYGEEHEPPERRRMRKNVAEALRTLRSKTRKEDADLLLEEEKSRWATGGHIKSLTELAQAILKKEEEENNV